MLTAREKLFHLAVSLTEKQAEDVLELLNSTPRLATNVQEVRDDLRKDGYTHRHVDDVLTSVVYSLLPCAVLFPREEVL